MRRRRYIKPMRSSPASLSRKHGLYSVRTTGSARAEGKGAKKIVLAFFFGGVLIWFFYFFLVSDNFRINKIEISGNENISQKELLDIAVANLKNKRLMFLKNNNILFFSKESLIQDIGEKYIVEDIKVTKKFPFTLKININEKLSRVVLRTQTIVETKKDDKDVESNRHSESGSESTSTEDKNLNLLPGGENADSADASGAETGEQEVEKPEPTYTTDYYFLDVNGIIVSKLDISQEDYSRLPIIEIQLDRQTLVKPGSEFLDRETIEYIFAVYEAVGKSQKNIQIDYVKYDPKIKDELTFATKEGWQGLLTSKIALDTQIKKLELALEEKIKDSRINLQYVDLRVKDRVYFK